MSAFDVVIIALAGGTLRTAIIGDDPTMTGPFLGVGGILATHKLIAWVSTRFPFFNRWVEGFPAVIIKDGKRDEAVLRRQNIPDAALDRVLRGHGMEDEGEVLVGRLEPNGKITLVRRQN
jgi:Predicted membrane protein